MIFPEYFKFGSLLSVPLFAAIMLVTIQDTQNYSLRKQTVSKLINFINKPRNNILFRLNFILKAYLDLLFSLYVINFFRIPIASPISLMLIFSAVFFALLAYFVEGEYHIPHVILVFLSGALWALGFSLIVWLTGDELFSIFSTVMIILPVIIGLLSFNWKKINVFIQMICVGIWYIWIVIFLIKYFV